MFDLHVNGMISRIGGPGKKKRIPCMYIYFVLRRTFLDTAWHVCPRHPVIFSDNDGWRCPSSPRKCIGTVPSASALRRAIGTVGGWGRVSLYETVGRRISKIALILGSPMDPIGILWVSFHQAIVSTKLYFVIFLQYETGSVEKLSTTCNKLHSPHITHSCMAASWARLTAWDWQSGVSILFRATPLKI